MAVACQQQGVMTRVQLRGIGLTDDAIDGMLKTKRLRPALRGVYLVSAIVGPQAREMAAVLACGGAGVISHWSAGALLELQALAGDTSVVHVSVTRGHCWRREGLRVHRTRLLQEDEVTKLHGIPLTTAARTVYDVASASSHCELERALAEALSRNLTNSEELRRILARYARQPGRAGCVRWSNRKRSRR
jgi:predicted transcriptional regulator of viral defense system